MHKKHAQRPRWKPTTIFIRNFAENKSTPGWRFVVALASFDVHAEMLRSPKPVSVCDTHTHKEHRTYYTQPRKQPVRTFIDRNDTTDQSHNIHCSSAGRWASTVYSVEKRTQQAVQRHCMQHKQWARNVMLVHSRMKYSRQPVDDDSQRIAFDIMESIVLQWPFDPERYKKTLRPIQLHIEQCPLNSTIDPEVS